MNTTFASNIATTVLRVAVGSILIGHGSQKLFGWFGGGGISGTGKGMHALGFRPGKPHAVLAGLTETGAGAALVVGLATPAAGSAAAIAMGVAAGALARNGFFASTNGLEHPGVLGVVAATFALGGAGPVSLDAATAHVFDRPWMRAVGLTMIPLVVSLQLLRRNRILKRERAQEPVAAGT